MKERYLLVLVRGIGQTVCRRSRERISESRRWGRRSVPAATRWGPAVKAIDNNTVNCSGQSF